MKVSFKVSKKGSRYVPKPADNPANAGFLNEDKYDAVQPVSVQPSSSAFTNHNVADAREDNDGISDLEVSFTLNIFPDGYTIGNPSERTAQGIPEFSLPYNRASDNLFSAIECGHIPGDLPDDVPCKYINGTIICEVRDYRDCFSEPVPSKEASPIVNKVRLKMSLENVVKDISSIADTTWTYPDLLEAESTVVNKLHPKLYLDTTPDSDRLCAKPIYSKLNLSNLRKQRRQRASQVAVGSVSVQGTDRVPESSNSEPARHDQVLGSVSTAPATSLSGNDLMHSYTNMNRCSSVYSIHSKRGNPDGPLCPSSSSSKRAKATEIDGFIGPDIHQRNAVLSPLSIDRGMRYGNAGLSVSPQRMFEGSSQQSLLQQRPPQPFSRSALPQPLDNNPRMVEQSQKRKAGALPHSPLSSISGEFSSGSRGGQFGIGVMTASLLSSQKEKSAPSVGGTASLTSRGNAYGSTQRQRQVQMGKQRSNTLSKTAAMNRVKSLASVRNTSSSVATPLMADQGLLKKFSMIVYLTSRYQLNKKKNKIDQLRDRKASFPMQELKFYLSHTSNNVNFKDEACTMPLSKSVVGGSVNVHKMRVLSFVKLEKSEGNESQAIPETQTRLIMSHKGNDGTVAMMYGEKEDGNYLSVEDSLPILTNSHNADVLAGEMCRQILREGYHLEGDDVLPKPGQMSVISSGQQMQSVAETYVAQPSSEAEAPSSSGNRLTNAPQKEAETKNLQALQRSQGRPSPEVSTIPLSRPQQLEAQMYLPHHLPLPIELQFLHQHQYQQNEQRKLMMGLGNSDMANLGSQTSSPQFNSVALPPLPQSALTASKKKTTQGGGILPSQVQSTGVDLMAGGANRQMQLEGSSGASILAQRLGGASCINMNTMQRSLMGAMGPPNSMPNMNQHQHQQQQLQQQQELTWQSQSAVLPGQQVGSSSSLGMTQQGQDFRQQMSQQWNPMSEQQSSGGSHRSIGDIPFDDISFDDISFDDILF